MVVTDLDDVDDIDEALTYHSADLAVATAAGDLTRRLQLAEHVDDLLDNRPSAPARKIQPPRATSAETCQPLSPRRPSEISGPPSTATPAPLPAPSPASPLAALDPGAAGALAVDLRDGTVHRGTCPAAPRLAVFDTWTPDTAASVDHRCPHCLPAGLPTSDQA